MKYIEKVLVYLKHITFIGFIYAGIVLYPNLITTKLGICYFVIFILYCLVSFVMFFVKAKHEHGNVLNNFVVCFLHLYLCFIAYKYSGVADIFGIADSSYFKLNYFIAALSMFVLAVNKVILAKTK